MKKKIIGCQKLHSQNPYKIYLYFPFHLIFLFSLFSFSKKNFSSLYNCHSEIHLIINGNGEQNILSNSFYTVPSDFIVNGVSKKSSCSKKCTLENNYNNITLIFEDEINFCKFMFCN